MRILMLGWEFPPFISGGLGTACYGLTRGLDRQGHDVIFVLPRPVDRSHASHVTLLSPEPDAPLPPLPASPRSETATATELIGEGGSMPGAAWQDAILAANGGAAGSAGANPGTEQIAAAGLKRARILAVRSRLRSTYPGAHLSTVEEAGVAFGGRAATVGPGGAPLDIDDIDDASLTPEERAAVIDAHLEEVHGDLSHKGDPTDHYSGDLFAEAARYARLALRLSLREKFDVIHAHDWLTYPAGMTIARATGKPLVVHVHATEFDRSGEHVNQRVYDIERRGINAAIRVICVSEFTKRRVLARYGANPARVRVVYNGIESGGAQPLPGVNIEAKDKIVLFLGRITMQKGPEYFIQAAKRVLEKMDNVKFLVAGSGDMATRMIEYAASLGIGHKVLFTGFLRGRDVARVFEMADLFVMPSVSEPFGIAPLEAIHHGTPVLISRQSGVSEVLTHALKADFWDVDEMANKIIAVLRHPPLHSTLRAHGMLEIRKLTWDGAAQKCSKVYQEAIGEMAHV